MCLLAVLFHVHPEAPVVIAANRDERYARAAEAIQVLRPSAPRVLGGRDMLGGGTWLAVNEHGVYAGVTNRPSSTGRDPSRRSRGELPLALADHTRASDAVVAFQKRIRCSEYNPCWLLVGDRDALFYVMIGGNEQPEVEELSPGVPVVAGCLAASIQASAEPPRIGPRCASRGIERSGARRLTVSSAETFGTFVVRMCRRPLASNEVGVNG